MELKKSWKEAWELGKRCSEKYASEDEACKGMSLSELRRFEITGYDEFFHAGFIGRQPEWVEAFRYGEIPECGYSVNWAEHKRENGVSCVKIIRNEDDWNYKSIYDVTLVKLDKIKVAGWYLGGVGSDGEPLLLGCVKID